MSFFSELRRRNVFKVGAAYAVVAWLLLQITDVVLPTFNTPEWVAQTITFVLAIGFPVAVILAWAFDLTPQGIKTTSKITSDLPPQTIALRFGYISQAVILVAVGFLVVDQYFLEPRFDATELETTAIPYSRSPAGAESAISRLSIVLGRTEPIGNTELSAHLAISPNGRHIAYVIQRNASTQLYLRVIDELEAHPIPGTDGAYYPFFSDDGQSLAFFSDITDQKLKTVSIHGGPVRTLTDARVSPGGSWVGDAIVYASINPAGERVLNRIPATGGEPETLVPPDPRVFLVWPEVLPNGYSLITLRPAGGPVSEGTVALLSLETGEYRRLLENAYNAQYTSSEHIVFMRAGALWAVPFDLEPLAITGPEVPLIENLESDAIRGGAAFDLSATGTLVYAPGAATGDVRNHIVQVDRTGREEAITSEPSNHTSIRISPTGQRLAYTQPAAGMYGDIWIRDLPRETVSRLTFSGQATELLWTPDGQQIVYGSQGGLFMTAVDRIGEPQLLWSGDGIPLPDAFSVDGSQLLFTNRFEGTNSIFVLPMEAESEIEPLLVRDFHDGFAVVSPNGRWLAHESDETGRFEVYVRPFPNVEQNRVQVSTNGGSKPLWGRDGAEVFYRNLSGGIMVARVENEEIFSVELPMEVAPGPYRLGVGRRYDISSDGEKLLVVKAADEVRELTDTAQLIVVTNWFDELSRRVPPSAQP